jgi:hypothetical protein
MGSKNGFNTVLERYNIANVTAWAKIVLSSEKPKALASP